MFLANMHYYQIYLQNYLYAVLLGESIVNLVPPCTMHLVGTDSTCLIERQKYKKALESLIICRHGFGFQIIDDILISACSHPQNRQVK